MFVKVQLCVRRREKEKYLIQFAPQIQLTVSDFLSRVTQLCELKCPTQSLQISHEGYILPHRMSSGCIKDVNVYKVFFKKNKQNKRKKVLSESSSSSEQQEHVSQQQSSQQNQQISEQSSENHQLSSTPVIKSLPSKRIKELIKSNIQQPKPRQNKIEKFIKKNISSAKSSSSSSSEDESMIAKRKRKIKRKPKPESSSSQSESPLPILPKKTVEKPKVNKIIPLKNVQKKMRQIRVVGSSSQSSLSESEQVVKKPVKVEKVVQKKQKKPMFVPISVKSKPFLSFVQNQEKKWITITKQMLKKWQEEENSKDLIIGTNNKIRFKIIELDEQKFIPVTSGWIKGSIVDAQKNGNNSLIKLQKVSRQVQGDGKPIFEKQYQIPFINMQQLQIHKDIMTEKQRQFFMKSDGRPEKLQKVEVQQQNIYDQNEKDSLQDYICGQIHYYFTDKNYLTDLFMQMHANKDDQKYIPIKLMLNFPKVKKVLKDEDKLWQYLILDLKSQRRSYELDEERRMIRKKMVREEKQVGSEENCQQSEIK